MGSTRVVCIGKWKEFTAAEASAEDIFHSKIGLSTIDIRVGKIENLHFQYLQHWEVRSDSYLPNNVHFYYTSMCFMYTRPHPIEIK